MFIRNSGKCAFYTFLLCSSTFIILTSTNLGFLKSVSFLFSSDTRCVLINETDVILETIKTVTGCEDNFAQFRLVKKRDYWIAYNYVMAKRRFKCQESVTYVTHSDVTFLNNLIPLLERWRGPISVAIHAPGSDLKLTVRSISFFHSCVSLVEEYVTFHLYFPHEHFPGKKLPQFSKYWNTNYNCSEDAPYQNVNRSETYAVRNNLIYPVNLGRNIARSMAETHYVLTSDIELYPSLKLIPQFLKMVAECCTFIDGHHPAVFALQVFEIEENVEIPQDKTELQRLLKKQHAVPFHQDLCNECHAIPKTMEWERKNQSDALRVFNVAKRTGKFYHWEPFYIGTKSDPDFDERLSWQGMSDKIVQAYTLCLLEYSFLILDNAFLVHRPGIKKSNLVEKSWRKKYIDQTDKLINNIILPDIHKKYGRKYECRL